MRGQKMNSDRRDVISEIVCFLRHSLYTKHTFWAHFSLYLLLFLSFISISSELRCNAPFVITRIDGGQCCSSSSLCVRFIFFFIKSPIQTTSLNGNRFSSVLILWNRLAERDNCDARRNHFRGIDLWIKVFLVMAFAASLIFDRSFIRLLTEARAHARQPSSQYSLNLYICLTCFRTLNRTTGKHTIQSASLFQHRGNILISIAARERERQRWKEKNR